MDTIDDRRPGEADFLRATRTAYDTVADSYAAQHNGALASLPLERAMLAPFAELASAVGPVADIGCGSGYVTDHLRSLGADAFGIDLSPAMVDAARRAYPDGRYEVGSMTRLDLPDGGLGGVLAMYSIIHIPPSQLPTVFAEFRRVLAPGGWVLLVFQTAEQTHRRVTEWLGHTIDLDQHRHPIDGVADRLTEAGFEVRVRMRREPDGVTATVARGTVLATVGEQP